MPSAKKPQKYTYGLTRPPPGLAACRYMGNCTSALSSVSFAAADEPVAEAGRGRNGEAASHGLACRGDGDGVGGEDEYGLVLL